MIGMAGMGEHLYGISGALFEEEIASYKRFCFWRETYNVSVILYALLEAKKKTDRTPNMQPWEVADFAEVVMRRKQREVEQHSTMPDEVTI